MPGTYTDTDLLVNYVTNIMTVLLEYIIQWYALPILMGQQNVVGLWPRKPHLLSRPWS